MSVSFVSRPSVQIKEIKEMKHPRVVLAVGNLSSRLFWKSLLTPFSRTLLLAAGLLNLALAPNAWAGKATVPAAPSGFTATAVSASQITLNWQNIARNASDVKIDRALSCSGPSTIGIATLGAEDPTYNDP